MERTFPFRLKEVVTLYVLHLYSGKYVTPALETQGTKRLSSRIKKISEMNASVMSNDNCLLFKLVKCDDMYE